MTQGGKAICFYNQLKEFRDILILKKNGSGNECKSKLICCECPGWGMAYPHWPPWEGGQMGSRFRMNWKAAVQNERIRCCYYQHQGGKNANRLKKNILKKFDTAQYVTVMPQGGTETSQKRLGEEKTSPYDFQAEFFPK